MNAQQIDRTEEEFEEYLRDIHGDVDICGVSCDAVDAFKLVDETSFDAGYADWNAENRPWQCDKCDEVYADEEEAESCCEDMDNDEFDEQFLESFGDKNLSELLCNLNHNELNADQRTIYCEMVDGYQKDGRISERQSENFTFNGGH